MRYDILCKYCGLKTYSFIYDINNIKERCYKCNEPITIENILKQSSTDCYGYNHKYKNDIKEKIDYYAEKIQKKRF
jgi:hypothetical protein